MTAKIVEHDDGTASVVVSRKEWLYHNFTCEQLHALFKSDRVHGVVSCECHTLTEAEDLARRMDAIMATNEHANMVTNAATGQTISIAGISVTSSGSGITANSMGKWVYTVPVTGTAASAATVAPYTMRYTKEQKAFLLCRDLEWLEDEEIEKAVAFAKFCLEKMKSLTALDLLNGDTRSLMSEEDVAGFVRDVLGLDVDVTIKGRGHDSSGDGGNAGEDILHE